MAELGSEPIRTTATPEASPVVRRTAIREITYPDVFREALAVSKRVGTWVLYLLRDEPRFEHLVGYLIYRIADFDRRRQRAVPERRRYFSDRIAYWQRAIQLAQRLGRNHEVRRSIAARIIADLDRDPVYRAIPYVAAHEHDPDHVDDSKLHEQPRRGCGAPRIHDIGPLGFAPCETCNGRGFHRKRHRCRAAKIDQK